MREKTATESMAESVKQIKQQQQGKEKVEHVTDGWLKEQVNHDETLKISMVRGL